jgi:RNA polymerase sigma factor (sigma-70 family)
LETSSTQLLAACEAGDELAAAAVFDRYVARLTWLARSRLAAKLRDRVDAEDVVHSAYRSFFVAARQGRFSLSRSGDLWRLLVKITLRKVYRQAARHTAERRSVEREAPATSFEAAFDPAAVGPTAEEAVAAVDELQDILSGLSPFSRRVVELRLQDCGLDEIAADTGRSERTVRRTLAELRQLFERRLLDA